MAIKPIPCCEFMVGQVESRCEQHGDGAECPNVIIGVGTNGKPYLISRNGNYDCNYCPACGAKQ